MGKMINCKSCNAEIASSAKICPQCGAKNKKPFYAKWWVWVIAAVVILSIASAGSKKNPTASNPPTSNGAVATQENQEKQETTFKIGDVVTTDKFEITILSVEEKTSVGSEYFNSEPADGGVYVAVKWEYKNISKEPIGMFSFPKITLQDANDTKYSTDLSASSNYATEIDKNKKVVSDLNPGIKVVDGGVFEISEESYANSGWKLLVEADKKFTVDIK